MASRSLDDLHPLLKPLALQFLAECKAAGIQVMIYCTWRSDQEQAELYKIGRTVPGAIRTRAKPGQSAHNFMIGDKPAARAFDCCPTIGGKPVWNERHMLYKRMGLIGVKLGLTWYGSPGSRFKESVHFQLPN